MNSPNPQPRYHPHDHKITIGNRYDEYPVQLDWPYLPHTLIAGVTRSGKSSWVASIIAAIAADRNTAIFGIDPKQVELAFWNPRLTTLATTGPEAIELLQFIINLMEHRKKILNQHGTRHWNTTYGPAILLVVEELAELKAIAGKEAINLLQSLARLSAAFGITLICTTQYPLAAIVTPELRANLEGKIANRVTGKEQIDVALGQGMSDHINPNSITKNEQGTAYVLGFRNYGTETKCRAFYPTDNYIKARANQTKHLRITPQTLLPEPPNTDTDDLPEAA